jgi:hypothetical protein
MDLLINQRSRSIKKTVFVFLPLLIAAFLLTAAVGFALMPAESYPVRGTFRYSVYIMPEWLNTTYSRGIIFWYGCSYDIVEPELAAVNSRLLQVKSESPSYNQSATESFSRGIGPDPFSPGYNLIWSSYVGEGNLSTSGTLFEQAFLGPELPFFNRLPPLYRGSGYYVNMNDLISQANVTDGSVRILWQIWLNDIAATVNPTFLAAHFEGYGADAPLCDINVTVQHGSPVEIHSGNFSAVTSQSFDLPLGNLTVESPLDLYSPSVLFAKGVIPYLAGAGLLLIIVEVVLVYLSKPNTLHDKDSALERNDRGSL